MPVLSFAWPPVTRILALGAHCDDIELGCGGLLQRLAQECPHATLRAVFFSGSAERAAESQTCMHALFPAERMHLEFLTFQDAHFPLAWGEIKQKVHELARAYQPDLVLTHRRGDAHQDHRILQELSWNAFRAATIWEYEIPKYEDDQGPTGLYVPLSKEELERKIEAILCCHVSQLGKPWLDAETIRGLARLRGMHAQAPSGYAEAFFAAKTILS